MLVMKVSASLSEDGVEVIDGIEVVVSDWLVDEGPEVFGRLEFWRIGRQVDEPDAGRHIEARFGVPSGIVKHENYNALASSTGFTREVREQLLEERLVDAVREIPDGLPARRRHEDSDVEPLVAMVTERDRPLADGSPDPAMDRLQAEPMLVRRPYFDRYVGMLAGFFGECVSEVFLNASTSCGPAAFGFFGRGDWIDQLSFLSASQPRGA